MCSTYIWMYSSSHVFLFEKLSDVLHVLLVGYCLSGHINKRLISHHCQISFYYKSLTSHSLRCVSTGRWLC